MKYKFNFDKWVINHFGMLSTATITKEERDFFMKTILKHNGEVFSPNEGSHFVGNISVNIGYLDNPKNMITDIEAEDCDADDAEFSMWLDEFSNRIYSKSVLTLFPSFETKVSCHSYNSYEVDKVYPNEKKGVTCVIFKSGDKRILKVSKKEPYCVETAVAYAIAEQVYGSNSAFTKEVQNSLPIIKTEKKFSYDLWNERNKSDGGDAVARYDGMTLARIKEIANSFERYPNGTCVVDGEFSIDLKKDLK